MQALRLSCPHLQKFHQRPQYIKPKSSIISVLALRTFSKKCQESHKKDYVKLTELEIGPDTYLEREFECHKREILSANRISIYSALTLLFLGTILAMMNDNDEDNVGVPSIEKIISDEFGEID